MMKNTAVVLAAGKGTRMKSELPKVLFEVCSRPMIEFVLDALAAGGVERTIVVVGYRADLVRQTLADKYDVEFALQSEQLGTGHAVMSCREQLADCDGPVVVVTGDSPMMQAESIAALLAEFRRANCDCVIGTGRKDNPTGLGRIVRDSRGNFVGIVEEKDATDEQRQITEVNMSYYVFDCQKLLAVLDEIRADNAQGEYYITDAPGIMASQGMVVRALNALKPCESLGVNNLDELKVVEAAMQQQEATD